MLDIGRDSALAAAVILVAIIAIALSAATIASVEGGEIGFGGNDGPSTSEGGVDGPDLDRSNSSGGGEIEEGGQILDLQVCIHPLQTTAGILGVFLGLVAILGLIYYRYNASTTLLSGTALLPPVFGGYFFATNCPGGGSSDNLLGFSPSPSPGGGSGVQELPIPSEAIVVGLVVLTGIAAVMVFTSTRGDEKFEMVAEDDEPEADAADFADAAGRAADRIEDANVPVDNAVYRAWVEMTRLLNMSNPKTSTPKDFAEKAIGFGLNGEDVSELTQLFVEVRYGGESPEGKEDRAIKILRNFEAEYSDEMTDPTTAQSEEDQ